MDALSVCQLCRARLNFVEPGVQSQHQQHRPADSSVSSASVAGLASELAGQRIDESFVLLEGAVKERRAHTGAHDVGASQRGLEDSFMMVGSASLLRQPGAGAGQGSSSGGGGAGPPGSQSVVGRVPLDPVFDALARIFQIAAEDTKVEQPLCLDCAEKVQKELEAQVRELSEEVSSYEAALQRLQAQEEAAVPSHTLQQQLADAQQAEQQERERLARAEAEYEAAVRELDAANQAAGQLGQLEERYWHGFNDLMLQLQQHVDERDALLTRTENAQQQLERLRRVNVYSDVFYIWHDGAFGTISGFRLGRTPAVMVEWDEINAAWGQAVLLLHTMAQACKLSFTYRLIPLGSYPRVADRKNTYDLFGPVSKLYCTSYDRAMACFLTCLKEFAMFAAQRDSLAGRRQVFELPYSIEGTEVGGLTIKLMFNKDARWTKALKYMLTDLKWCLEWMIVVQDGASAASSAAGAGAEEQQAAGRTQGPDTTAA